VILEISVGPTYLLVCNLWPYYGVPLALPRHLMETKVKKREYMEECFIFSCKFLKHRF
jgi:hypothetical protein